MTFSHCRTHVCRYLAHGTATDYMYEELHVPMPFTWEIYGDEGAESGQPCMMTCSYCLARSL